MTLAELASEFASLSLLAIGGVNAIIPEIHRQAVEINRLVSEEEFRRLFALSQAAPGPNFLIVSLVGFVAQGVAGAIVSTTAICAPASFLAYIAASMWDRFRETKWRLAVQRGLAPITVGLVASTGVVLLAAGGGGTIHYGITAVAAALGLVTGWHPLLILLAAAIVGVATA